VFSTYSFSLLALSLASLSHISSNVASSFVCSLVLQCHGAPSAPVLGRDEVTTLCLPYILPRFQDEADERILCASSRIISSEGISLTAIIVGLL
jgi:hypothetical protein